METTDTISAIPSMSSPQPEVTAFTTVVYAGFWRRFAAYLIDGILLNIIIWPLAFIFGLGSVLSTIGMNGHIRAHYGYDANHQFDAQDAAMIGSLIGVYIMIVGVSFLVSWLYFSLMESSAKQGTLGKMALGIKVTDMAGNRIGFGKATGRFFGKIISGVILYIGFIMAGFTEKKQALHDMMASTLVVMK